MNTIFHSLSKKLNHSTLRIQLARIRQVFTILVFLASLIGMTPTVVRADSGWTAYNDCVYISGQISTNITTYHCYTNNTTGSLKDYVSGANVPATVTITTSGSVDVQNSGDIAGAESNSGTDAYTTFHNIVNTVGGERLGSASSYVNLAFTGLDPAKTYTFATTANRANPASDYVTRVTKFTISDEDAATNASTPGVTVVSELSVKFSTGYNTVNGYVARWTGIQPGSDGDFKVRFAVDTDTYAYGPTTFMLREETVEPPVQHTLTVGNDGNGSVTLNPSGGIYDDGTVVMLTPVPNSGYHFSTWGGTDAGEPSDNGDGTWSLTMNGDKSLTANFAINTYTLTYTAGANGSITGDSPQTVNYGASGTAVTAVPATGYQFVNWSDLSTANPRTDTNVTANISVTANFAINPYTLTYTAGANGSISGASPQTVNYGASGTAVTAVPATGYHFVNWSDLSTANPRTDTNVTANISVTATFAINTYTLTYTPGAHGSITGTSPQTVDYGASGTAVTAVPATSYHFVNWSDLSTANPRTDTNVTGNISVTANFAINTYTLTYAPGAHGSITGVSPQTVEYGGSGTAVTAVPATGYHFVDWSDGFPNATRTDVGITEDISVTANFAINIYTISGSTVAGATLSYTGDTSGSTNADGSGAYSISVPYGWNGTVTPSFAGCTFSPTDETYSNVAADITGEDYAATCSFTFKSVAANDGWVLESGESTNAGGSMNSADSTFNLGDDAANKQYRGILSFNTANMPDNAVIDSVKLRIKKSGVVGSDPFSSMGKITVDVKKGSFGNNPALQKTDFQAAASQNNAALFVNTLVSGWYSRTLQSGSFGFVDLLGTTQFRLRFQTDDDNDHVADYLQIFSANAAASSRPQLVITYHTP